MARGWESKSIEGQQEEARRDSDLDGPREAAATDERRSLELVRARMVALLDAAPTEEHQRSLQRGLDDLDARIARLRLEQGS